FEAVSGDNGDFVTCHAGHPNKNEFLNSKEEAIEANSSQKAGLRLFRIARQDFEKRQLWTTADEQLGLLLSAGNSSLSERDKTLLGRIIVEHRMFRRALHFYASDCYGNGIPYSYDFGEEGELQGVSGDDGFAVHVALGLPGLNYAGSAAQFIEQMNILG